MAAGGVLPCGAAQYLPLYRHPAGLGLYRVDLSETASPLFVPALRQARSLAGRRYNCGLRGGELGASAARSQYLQNLPSMIPAYLREAADGVSLAVKLQPRASRNAIQGMHGSELKIAVTAAPVDSAANS